jgi:hypothetical protein
MRWFCCIVIAAIGAVTQVDAGGRSCGFGYCPQAYYQQPTYQTPYNYSYSYPTPDLVYVQSAVLYNAFSFQYQPPTTILQLYGVPQINSVTTTTTTTSAVSNGAVQQVVNGQPVGVASASLSQFTSDGAPVARMEQQPRNELVGDPHSAVSFLSLSGPKKCVSCHSKANASGGFDVAAYDRNDRAQRRKVISYLASRKCPQGGARLTDEEESQFILGR